MNVNVCTAQLGTCSNCLGILVFYLPSLVRVTSLGGSTFLRPLSDRAEAEALSVWDLSHVKHPRLVTLWNMKVKSCFDGLNNTASKLCCAYIDMYAGL